MNRHSSSSHKPKVKEFSIRRVLLLLSPHKLLVLCILGCILVAAVLGIIPPLLTAQIIDQSIPHHNEQQLFIDSFIIIGTALGTSVLGVVQTYLNSFISQRIMADMRIKLYSHLINLPLRFFHVMKLGDLVSRFNNDINGIQGFVVNTLVSFISSAVIITATLIYMFAYNWLLAAISIIIIPIFAFPIQQVGSRSRVVSLLVQEKLAELGTILVETLDISALLLIKIFSCQGDESIRFDHGNKELMRAYIRQSMVGRWFFMFTGLALTVGPALIYLIGGLEVMNVLPGHITLGGIVAFIALSARIYSPTSRLMNIWVDVQRSKALFIRIFALLDLQQEQEIEGTRRRLLLSSERKHIVFDKVCFAYEDGYPVLHNISFEIPPGKTVALVGPSGSGKTTITHLLARFYEVNSGTIYIDNIDAYTLEIHELRKQIGIVTQEPYLFHASLRANISYGSKAATDAQIVEAARAANIHDVITRLPQKYDTIVGEKGYKFSGGEKQRIALARVILKNAPILILDEPTSSLDTQSEALIQEALKPFKKHRTTIIIAHRLSTILEANTILVVENGHIVEQGSHHELLKCQGLYTKLYRKQFKVESEPLR